jgi:hypothetical protein
MAGFWDGAGGGIVGGAISALGGIAGGLMGSNAEKNALNFQKGMASKSILSQLQSQVQNEGLLAPGYAAYQAATPLLSYLVTGVNTGADFTDQDMQRLDTLRDRKNQLIRDRNIHMSSSTGDRDNQRWHNDEVSKINAKLAQLQDLENRYAASQAMQSIGDNGLIETPGYAWQKQQGEEAVNRALAARGMHNSRVGVNALSDFNQNLNANTYRQQVSDLYNVSNLGRGAASTAASLGQNSATNIGNTYMNAGQNIAQGMVNRGQTLGGTVSNALGAIGNGISNYSYMNALSDMGSNISNLNSSGSIGGAFNPSRYSVMG